ncbi:cytochrome bd oxidase small subunit CydS [Sporosarcina koreensis]
MSNFIIFYAPFIILIAAIVVAFVISPMDGSVRDKKE